MAIDYVAAAATATRLITENGRDITLRKPSSTPVDPAKPWGAAQTDAVASDDEAVVVKGVFLGPVKSHAPLAVNAGLSRPSEVPEEQSSQLLIEPHEDLPEELDTQWVVIDGTRRWEILSIIPVKPAGTLVYYDAVVAL
jgi:hypothetical protein